MYLESVEHSTCIHSWGRILTKLSVRYDEAVLL